MFGPDKPFGFPDEKELKSKPRPQPSPAAAAPVPSQPRPSDRAPATARAVVSTTTTSTVHQCSHCSAPAPSGKLKKCARCRTARYCNQDCQRAAGPHHKTVCQPSSEPGVSLNGAERIQPPD
eukprot:TRINITY_DN11708_c0_g1_i1.p1 TRINITY_DN11708_c0_g1~~TRINITY_DN11708_c0_g1_i1.p1  ORF type:complete len:122 (+),score=5.67 TRINITY_DN11708_c0_g1_i1:239-604(+)